ncbi:MAG: Lrp/AsnC family transcriptional regulator [Promethearchaeota archaeon]
MELDNIDKQILNILFNNGRENLSQIKEKVQKPDLETMSHTGVRKRINKLKSSGILKVQGNLSIRNLEYQIALILMEMKNYSEINKVIEAYSTCPRVFLLAQVTGRYNLILGIVGQNIEVLQRYINHCGPTNKEGVLHSDILIISNLEAPRFLPLNIFSKESQESKCDNICKDCAAFLDGKCKGCGNF